MIVFINKIENIIRLKKYLRFRLPNYVCNEKPDFVVIQLITSNLDANIKTQVIKDLQYKIIPIYIYIKYISMSINIFDIIYIIQFKIPEFIVLPKLL